MKFHNITEDILGTKVKLLVLKILIRYQHKRFSGRELARLLKLSSSRVLQTLEAFRRYGFVERARIGKTAEWVLNREHFLVKELQPLIQIDRKAKDLLEDKIRRAFRKAGVLKVIIFGSILKAEERPESDIDIFILVEDGRTKGAANKIADDLNQQIIPLFGNLLSPIIYSKAEFERKKKSKLIQHIMEEGKVIL